MIRFGFVSSAAVVATATGGFQDWPSLSDQAMYTSWFVAVTSCWNATYVRPWLSRASVGRFWLDGSVQTATLGANGKSVGAGPGPDGASAAAGTAGRAVSGTDPPRCS